MDWWNRESEREGMRITNQQRDDNSSGREETDRDVDLSSPDGSVTDHEDSLPEHVRREQLRSRAREARLQLLTRMEGERRRELHGLLDNTAVSGFAGRGHLQSLLRSRFFRNGSPIEEQRPPFAITRELGHLRQQQRVSGLREGFRYRLENIFRDQVSHQAGTSVSHDANRSNITHSQLSTEGDLPNETNMQPSSSVNIVNIPEMQESQVGELDEDNIGILQQNSQNGMGERQLGTENGLSELDEENDEESDVIWEESNHSWPQEIPEVDRVEDVENWHDDNSNATVENWQDEHSNTEGSDHLSMGRTNRFIFPDEESVYSLELRELLNRRSVSNVLQSGFRESLDQLIHSYVQRQGHSPINWHGQRGLHNSSIPVVNHNHEENININQVDSVAQIPVGHFPQMPSQPNLQRQNQQWSPYRILRRERGSESINDLRAEMTKLQQGMNHMQRILETCMDMQLELQRSVRQEVSAALNRSFDDKGTDDAPNDLSRLSRVRKGICCICCDRHINSLLFRCGHMCTCLRCASDLIQDGDKCPLCRAPIVEAIRAYSIL